MSKDLTSSAIDRQNILNRTGENYPDQAPGQLARNGYEPLIGNRLNMLTLSIPLPDVPETDFGNISRAPQLGVLDSGALLAVPRS